MSGLGTELHIDNLISRIEELERRLRDLEANAVTGTPAVLSRLRGTALSASISVGAEAANVINVAVELSDGNGSAISTAAVVNFYLANDASGQTATTTAPNGGIAIGTDGVMIEWAANLSGLLVSEADGGIDINLTHSSTGTWYLVVVLPSGERVISEAITFT